MQQHIFPDFSLTTLKFPDFSRFSRWVATLCMDTENKAQVTDEPCSAGRGRWRSEQSDEAECHQLWCQSRTLTLAASQHQWTTERLLLLQLLMMMKMMMLEACFWRLSLELLLVLCPHHRRREWNLPAHSNQTCVTTAVMNTSVETRLLTVSTLRQMKISRSTYRNVR